MLNNTYACKKHLVELKQDTIHKLASPMVQSTLISIQNQVSRIIEGFVLQCRPFVASMWKEICTQCNDSKLVQEHQVLDKFRSKADEICTKFFDSFLAPNMLQLQKSTGSTEVLQCICEQLYQTIVEEMYKLLRPSNFVPKLSVCQAIVLVDQLEVHE